MKLLLYICSVALLSFWITSCSSSSEPGKGKDTTTHVDSNYLDQIRLVVHHLPALRQPEGYAVWFKLIGQNSWQRVKTINTPFYRGDDSTSILYSTTLAPKIDSLSEVLLTLEKDTSVATAPGLELYHGFFVGDSAFKIATLNANPLGDFSQLNSSIVFTTQSSDTTAYIKELYLADYESGKIQSSLSALPTPPSGWKFGIWSIDSVNFPVQTVYYGQFTSPFGHDSDSSNDAQAFPGGFTNAPMNQPHGSIIVTLEPDWYGNDVKFKGPSPFTLLRFDRTRFLLRDHNYPMFNVSETSTFGGYIYVKHK